MEKIVLKLYDYLNRHRLVSRLLPLFLLLLLGYGSSRITLEEDIAGFLPDGTGNKQVLSAYRNLRSADKIVLTLQTREEIADADQRIDRLAEAADRFIACFDSLDTDDLVGDKGFRIDPADYMEVADFITANLPYFVEEEAYFRLDSILTFTAFDSLFIRNREWLLSPTGSLLKQNLTTDPFHFSASTLEKLKEMGMEENYRLIGEYLYTADSTRLVMWLSSAHGGSETEQNGRLVDYLEQTARSVAPLGVEADYLGAPVIAVTNAERIKNDAFACTLIALSAIVALLGWYFRRLRHLLLICVPILFGILFGLTLLGLFQHTVSAIALGAGSVILGIGVDYALHYLIHLSHVSDRRAALKDITTPMVIGNLTTVGAFLCLLIMSTPAMRDFGLFAALSLVGTILSVLVFLPQWTGRQKHIPARRWIGRWADYRMEDKKGLFLLVVLLTLPLLWFSNRVRFDTDFQRINYMTPGQRESLSEFNRLQSTGSYTTLYAVAEGDDLNEALRRYEVQQTLIDTLIKRQLIGFQKGIGSFFPSDSAQTARIRRWNAWKAAYGDRLVEIAREEGKKAGFSDQAFTPFTALWNRSFEVKPADYFLPLQQTLLKGYLMKDEKTGKNLVLTQLFVEEAKVKDVYAAFEKENAKAASFLFDSASLTNQMLSILSDDFNKIFYICGFLVFFFLWQAFGRIELALLAFLPMAVSWVWITGIMGLAGIDFNIVNIILATFIFGLGDDYTIFMMDGLMYEYAYGKKMLSSYKTSVTLSALTMFIGVGCLAFAVHPAMHSLGVVAIIGMCCVVGMAFLLPPVCFKQITQVYSRKRWNYRLSPLALADFLTTLYAFLVFLAGTVYLKFYGYYLFAFRRKSETKKVRYHATICRLSRYVVRHMPRIPCHTEIPPGEDFRQPAVLICNHQSHLDLMYLLQLSPKIIVLTNRWVWNSPFYGRITHYADYYPVINGIENSLEPLGRLIGQGYSIAVFPEGTRSEEGHLLRFHRGAFFLAEQLGVDLLPVVMHGIGHALPKKEWIMKPGSVGIRVLNRISPSDARFGNDYQTRTREIRKLFVREYARLAGERETPAYFAARIKGMFRYKDRDTEKAVARQLGNVSAWGRWIGSLPPEACLRLHIQTGVLALAAVLCRKDIRIGISGDNQDRLALVLQIARQLGTDRIFPAETSVQAPTITKHEAGIGEEEIIKEEQITEDRP